MTTIEKIKNAGAAGQLLPSTVENATTWLEADLPEWVAASVDDLVDQSAWDELNDRFYRYLAFGTGGMRGRTMGRIVTDVEMGTRLPARMSSTISPSCAPRWVFSAM